MKKLFLFFVLNIAFIAMSFGQLPEAFKYQSVARDNTGKLLANKNIAVLISVLQGSLISPPVYSERFTVTTNEYGIFNLNIGQGTPVYNIWANIHWATGTYFVSVSVDPDGGTSYTLMGSSQLLSVPYSLYSKSASDLTIFGENGQTLRYNGINWEASTQLFNDGKRIGIGTTMPQSVLDIRDTVTLPWAYKFQIYNDGFEKANIKRTFLSQGWDWFYGDFAYFGSSGNRSNTKQSAIILTQHYGTLFGRGTDNASGLNKYWMQLDTNGNLGLGMIYPQRSIDVYRNYSDAVLGLTSGTYNAGVVLSRGASNNYSSFISFSTQSNPDWLAGTTYGSSDFKLINWLNGGYLKIPFMIKQSNNNVGIGTENPDFKLTLDIDNLATQDGIHIKRKLASQALGIKLEWDSDLGKYHIIYDEKNTHALGIQSWNGIIFFSNVSVNPHNMFYDNNGNLGIETQYPTERLTIASGNMNFTNSAKGIMLDAQDKPIITRGWDAFTSGAYSGLGRWGMFMEPMYLTLGIPYVGGRGIKFSAYNENSTVAADLMTVSATGDVTVQNSISSPVYKYSTPKVHYYSLCAADFRPVNSTAAAVNGGGNGGAYATVEGSNTILSAPVHLPDGAIITGFKVMFYNNASAKAANLSVTLEAENLTSSGYATISSSITPVGVSGYGNVSGTINSTTATVNNLTKGYLVWVYNTNWDASGNLKIKGATITYTTENAE